MANLQQTTEGPPPGAGQSAEPAAAETAVPEHSAVRGRFQVFLDWAQRHQLERKLAIILLVATVLSGTATFGAITGHLPVAADPFTVLLLLNLDLVLLLGLSALIARRLVVLWIARKRGAAGARLHGRLVALFSLVAVAPTIVVATFSVVLFSFGLQGWFSERVSTAVKESMVVAESYLYEHRQTINADALAMAQDLNREVRVNGFGLARFGQVLNTQVALRSLTEAAVYDGTGRVLGRAGYTLLLDFDPRIPDWALAAARSGEVVILTAPSDDRVRALLRLDAFDEAYLVVGRLIDPRVLGHIDSTRNAVQLYEELEGKRSGMQITFAMIFVVVALMLLLAAVWVGLTFANQLTRPIGSLIAAAESVRGGDLSARVSEQSTEDEIGNLSRSFNLMTGALQRQQEDLLVANQQLDERSRFIEAVLGGVSSGVVGLDDKGRVTLPNRAACTLLDTAIADLTGRRLSELIPEIDEMIHKARRKRTPLIERSVTLQSRDDTQRTLLIKVSAERDKKAITGFVVTFDDITELLSAQRKAAWADVARRIAHEIKNPLTPIQLSAERLKRKYLKEIESDPDTFAICTDTIVRHVGDIGRMVDEFSSFARMPAPRMTDQPLSELVKQAVFLQRSAQPGIEYVEELPEAEIILSCDNQQIGRALTNLLLNAAESIEARRASDPAAPQGRIVVRLHKRGDGSTVVDIEDNGKGLPKAERHRLTEPYVTSREKGTGLGLAIVKKIMEDHGGSLQLNDVEGTGARVSLIFHLVEPSRAGKRDEEPTNGTGVDRSYGT